MNLDSLPLSRKQVVSVVEALRPARPGESVLALWTGAVAAGKTVASLVAFLIAVADAPDSGLIVIAGWTLQSIERNILNILQDEALFGEFAGQVHHTPGSSTAVILGRTVHLIGASDTRAEARIRGATIALGYIDEATLIPETFWVMMMSRLRVPRARLLATTNPAGPSHWLRRDYILRAAAVGMRHWHFTLDDNPFLPAGFVEQTKQRYTGLFYKRFIEGLWIAAEGVIYDMWDPDVHVVDIVPPIADWIGIGIDHGTTAPLAALILGLSNRGGGEDGRRPCLFLVDEWRWDSRQQHRQLSDAEYSQKLRDWIKTVRFPGTRLHGPSPRFWVVDPSAPSFRQQLFNDGIPTGPADNAVMDGIMTVSSLLAQRRLKVSRQCKGWTDEISGYSWDDRAAMMGEDKPVKVDDHSLDAGRYVIRSTEGIWGTPIRQAA